MLFTRVNGVDLQEQATKRVGYRFGNAESVQSRLANGACPQARRPKKGGNAKS